MTLILNKVVGMSSAADATNRRELLEAMRTRVAIAVDDRGTPARDLAALTRRLMDIAKEIEALDVAESEDDIGRAISTPDEPFDPEAI